MCKVKHLSAAGFLSLVTAVSALGAPWAVDVRDCGAKPDGKTLCTKAIQTAIDRCAAAGGGTVYLPPGVLLSGTIYMKSHVTLRLDAGCTLLGSKDPQDYPHNVAKVRSYTDKYVRQSLIAGEDLQGVAIRGRGTIDGNGSAFRWKEYENRPYLIRLVSCRDVLIEGVRMQNSAMWMQHYLACDRVTVRNVTVWNHVTYNNDGLDIDGCHDVSIQGCMLDSDDDALCLKSTLGRACQNVTISNCVLSSHCNGLKMGTESNGGFENITITNCTICAPRRSKPLYGRDKGLAGIALEIVDGGHLNRVAVSNITMKGISVPIFMRLGNRARPFKKDMPKPGIGTFQNVTISNVLATDAGQIGCSISGLPGHPIEDVSLGNINLTFEGGGTKADTAREVPEKAESYPESTMFGELPAWGFYCRHIKGLKLNNVQLRTDQDDQRHALVCDDVENLVVDGLEADCSAGAGAMLRLAQVRRAVIRGCTPPPSDTFLKLQGDLSERIVLLGNDFSLVGKIAETTADVRKGALSQIGNHPVQQK